MTLEIVGHAIVSADGMIADAEHRMPAELRNDADFRRFQAALDAAALVVTGRLGHHMHPNPGRRRLVLTRRTARLSPDPDDPNAVFWNPEGLGFEAMLKELGVTGGTVAVTGGQLVFDYFLPLFTQFDLAENTRLAIPGGVPCFSAGPPETVLATAGMRLAGSEELDRDVVLKVFVR